jgi:hypothetical protein
MQGSSDARSIVVVEVADTVDYGVDFLARHFGFAQDDLSKYEAGSRCPA